MTTNYLVPNYMDVDFSTMKARLQEQLAKNDVFRDYNFEGSNITLLIELVSYLSALTTYYGNKIAQNQYLDTADLYETVHMLARLRGYEPKGYLSSEGTVTVTIGPSAGISAGQTYYIPAWTQLECSDEDIKFSTIVDTTATIPTTASFPYSFDLYVKQGEVVEYSYTGNDIVDNKLYLPNYNFDYDLDLDDDYPSIELKVNDVAWTRLNSFYNYVDELNNISTAYMLKYDKYERYYIEFSILRTVPEKTDTIEITILKSLGLDGNVATGIIDTLPTQETDGETGEFTGGFIYNTTDLEYLDNNYITITNAEATIGGVDPEVIDDIKQSSLVATHSQYRNVTKYDYITFLQSRPDVTVANAWGEQETSAPSGSFEEYNKVYLSLIPTDWGTGTISTSATSAGYDVPAEYSNAWKVELATYIEPYKMISAYEEFVLPEFVYFNYVVGIKVKRTYDFDTVANTVLNKLIYYFRNANQEFGKIVSFTDIIDYILDKSYVSTDDNFDQIKGIQTLIIRDINIPLHSVYEYNEIGNYPYYTTASVAGYENNIRHIQLGYNQFPVLDSTNCEFIEET